MKPVVSVEQGQLRGKTLTDRKNGTFYSFLGIPYAKPPVGELRFKPPQPAEPWEGVRDATKPGSCCYAMQDPDGLNAYTKIEERGSEDCLYLNVYTKQLPRNGEKLRPVMFWVHGGGFISGSSNPDMYGPEHLICEDVVVVSINYRLGIFGFLCLEDTSLGITGNAGLKDQVMALKWVHKNIRQFNGDPNNVTIFGESAGAASTNYLMLSPLCKGLFHKVIMMSGCAINCWARGIGNIRAVADVIGIDSSNEKKILEKLQKMSTQEVFAIQKRLDDPIQVDMYRPFVPVTEKPSVNEPFITKTPLELLISGEYNHVPVMIGYNSGESYIFPYWQEIGLFDIHWVDGDNVIVPLTLKVDKNSDKYKEIAEKIKRFYFGGDKIVEDSKGFYNLGSDYIIMRGAHVTARRLLENLGHPIYYYVISIETSLNEFKKESGVSYEGATHGDELNYIFHHTGSPKVPEGSEEDIGIERLVKMWTNFAKTSNPIDPTQDVFKGVNWQPITKDKIHYLDIGNDLVSRVDPIADRMALWDEIFSINPPNLRY